MVDGVPEDIVHMMNNPFNPNFALISPKIIVPGKRIEDNYAFENNWFIRYSFAELIYDLYNIYEMCQTAKKKRCTCNKKK